MKKEMIAIILLTLFWLPSCQQIADKTEKKTFNYQNVNITFKHDILHPVITIMNNKIQFYNIKCVDRLFTQPTSLSVLTNNDEPIVIENDSTTFIDDVVNILSTGHILDINKTSRNIYLFGIIYLKKISSSYEEKSVYLCRIGNTFNTTLYTSDIEAKIDFANVDSYPVKGTFIENLQLGTIIMLDKDYLLTTFYKGDIIDQYPINPDKFQDNDLFYTFKMCLGDYTNNMSRFSPRGFLEIKVGKVEVINGGLEEKINIPVEVYEGTLAIPLNWLAEKLDCAYSYYDELTFNDDKRNASWGLLTKNNPCNISRLIGSKILNSTYFTKDNKLLVVSLKEGSNSEYEKILEKGKTSVLEYSGNKLLKVKQLEFDLPFTPYIKNGQYMVPLLETCKQLGAEVHYRDLDKSILIAKFYKEGIFKSDK